MARADWNAFGFIMSTLWLQGWTRRRAFGTVSSTTSRGRTCTATSTSHSTGWAISRALISSTTPPARAVINRGFCGILWDFAGCCPYFVPMMVLDADWCLQCGGRSCPCRCAGQLCQIGTHQFSLDGGRQWFYTGTAYTSLVRYTDGSSHLFDRRERPHMVFEVTDQRPTESLFGRGSWSE